MKLGSSPEIKLSDALKLAQDDALDAKGKLFSMFLMKNPEYLKMTKEHSIGKSSLSDRRKFAEFYNKLYGETDENEYLDDQFKSSFPFYGKSDTKDEKFMSWLKGKYNGGREFAEDVAPKKGNMLEAREDKKKYLQSALEKFLQMPLDNLDDEHKKQVADWMENSSFYKARSNFVKQLMDNDPGFVRQHYDNFFKGRLDKNQTATMEDISDFINDIYSRHGMTFFNDKLAPAKITDMTSGSDTKKFVTLMNDKGEKFKLLPEQVVKTENGDTDIEATFKNIANTLSDLK